VLPKLSLKVRSAARPVLVVPFALLLLGIAFAILAPRYSPAAASGYALARVSLLWNPRAIRCRPHRTSYCVRRIWRNRRDSCWLVRSGRRGAHACRVASVIANEDGLGRPWFSGVLVVPVTAIILRFAAIAPSLMI